MFDALKSLSPKQRFIGFVIVVLISAATSLGTAYMSGSDCTEISEKYTKSIENYNKLIEITDEIQQKYLDAKKDIIIIQERLNQISEIMSEKSNTCTTKSSTKNSYDEDVFNPTKGNGGTGGTGTKDDTIVIKSTSPWSTPKKIIIKEKTIVTKTVAPEGAKSMIDSLLQITKKYESKK
jgi:hypothetical protein